MALIYDILPDVNKNIIRRNFWHGKTKLITLSAIYPAPCQQSGKDGLNRRKGSRVYVKKADGAFEAHLVALSCSAPPEGFARWSLRLLADKVVELDYPYNDT